MTLQIPNLDILIPHHSHPVADALKPLWRRSEHAELLFERVYGPIHNVTNGANHLLHTRKKLFLLNLEILSAFLKTNP